MLFCLAPVRSPKWVWRGDRNEAGVSWKFNSAELKAKYPIAINTKIDTSAAYAAKAATQLRETCKGFCGVASGAPLGTLTIGGTTSHRDWKGLCFGIVGKDVSLKNGSDSVVIHGSDELNFVNFTWKDLGVNSSLLDRGKEFKIKAPGYVNIQVVGSYGSCEGLTVTDNVIQENQFVYPAGKASWMFLNTDELYTMIVDSRDGQAYATVDVGGQKWMAENMNYETEDGNCLDVGSACALYGRHYKWKEATTVCPDGWHLPTQPEWSELFEAVGGVDAAASVLKSNEGWDKYSGDNSAGFSAVAAGWRTWNNIYYNQNENAYYWTSTELNVDSAYSVVFAETNISSKSFDAKGAAYLNVRCVKGPAPESSSSSEAAESSSSEVVESSSSVVVSECNGTVLYDETLGENQPLEWGCWGNKNGSDCVVGSYTGALAPGYPGMEALIGEKDSLYNLGHWGGLCITYRAGPQLSLNLDTLAGSSWDMVFVKGLISEEYVSQTVDFADGTFANAINMNLWSDTETEGFFHIVKITTKNPGVPIKGYVKSDYAPCADGDPSCFYWNGRSGEYRVNTNRDGGDGTSGEWWYWTDNDIRGKSEFIWPVPLGNKYNDLAFDPVIDVCGGICGQYHLSSGNYEYPELRVGFHVVGNNPIDSANVTDWDGLCITYSSEHDISVRLSVPDEGSYGWEVPAKELTKSDSLKMVRYRWDEFAQLEGHSGENISGEEAAQKLAAIVMSFKHYKGETSGNFHIYEIGSYGTCKGVSN